MDGTEQKALASRLLAALENGTLPPGDALFLAEDLDPVLTYVIVSYLRAIHPASDPAARSVLERVVATCSGSPALVRMHRRGAEDPVSRWFESEYDYGEFRGRPQALIDLIVDKLES